MCAFLDFYVAVAPATRTKKAYVLEELLSHGIACVIELDAAVVVWAIKDTCISPLFRCCRVVVRMCESIVYIVWLHS